MLVLERDFHDLSARDPTSELCFLVCVRLLGTEVDGGLACTRRRPENATGDAQLAEIFKRQHERESKHSKDAGKDSDDDG